MQIRPAPEQRIYEGWRLGSFAAGLGGDAPAWPRTAPCRPSCASLTRPRPRWGWPGPEAGQPAASRRLPGHHRLRGQRRRPRSPARRARPARVLERRRGARARRPARAGRAGATAAPTCATRCSTPGALVETLETVDLLVAARPALYAAVSEALRESLTEQGTPAGDPLPHLARVSGRRLALLHHRLCPAARIRSRSGSGPSAPPATRSWPPAARSPTITASGATTGRGSSDEVGELGVRGAARGQARRSTRPASSIPGYLARSL